MNVLRIELVREIKNLKEYKITYEEQDTFTVTLAGRTFNYEHEDDIENIPESVLDFTEKWILGNL